MSLRQWQGWRWTCRICGKAVDGQQEVPHGAEFVKPSVPAGWVVLRLPDQPPWVSCADHKEEGVAPMTGTSISATPTTPVLDDGGPKP